MKISHNLLQKEQLFTSELEDLLEKKGISLSGQRVLSGTDSGKVHNREPSGDEAYLLTGRIILYIEEHLCEEISLDGLAEEFGISKYQLIRLFRRKAGTTPWRFLMDKRIEKAKNLLEKGVPPGEAALDTGFYDQSHLTRTFREKTGCTPKAYQQEKFRNKN